MKLAGNCPKGQYHGCDILLLSTKACCGSKTHTRTQHKEDLHGKFRSVLPKIDKPLPGQNLLILVRRTTALMSLSSLVVFSRCALRVRGSGPLLFKLRCVEFSAGNGMKNRSLLAEPSEAQCFQTAPGVR